MRQIREQWAGIINDALEHAHVVEWVDHRSYARQSVEMEPIVKMGHASAALERCAEREQITAGEEPHAVTPGGQMNEAIRETRPLELFVERGREWLQEVGERVHDRAELAAQNLAGFVQAAARTMHELYSRPADRFEALPALDQSPRRDHTPTIELDQPGTDRARSAATTPAWA